MKKIIIFIITLWLYPFFVDASANDSSIYLIIKKKKKDNVYITYYDELNQLNSIIYTEASNIENVELKIKAKTPIILFNANKKLTPFLLYPNETVTIIPDGIKLNFYSNKDEIRNNEFMLFQHPKFGEIELFENKMLSLRIRKGNLTYKQINKIVDSFYNQKKIFIESFLKNLQLNKYFLKFSWDYIKYSELKNKLLFFNSAIDSKSDLVIKEVNNLIDYYNNDSLLIYNFYRNSVNTFSSVIGNLYKERKSTILDKLDFFNTSFKGQTKDYVLFWHGIRILNEQGNQNEILQFILKNCNNEKYAKFFMKKNTSKFVDNQSYIINRFNEKKLFDSLLKFENDNKLILIDLWASWCLPCINEIPKSIKLAASYASENKIEFFFLSLDDNSDSWKNAEANLIKGTFNKSYLLVDNFNSPFTKQFNITTIPRYILIGKDGKVISADAPRPSDPKLKILIDKYINQ